MKKPDIEEGSYLKLEDGIYCRVSRGWHGKDNAWLEVTYRKSKTKAVVTRSVEFGEIAEIAPEPHTDPK